MTVHRAPHAFSAALASLLIIVHASIDFKNKTLLGNGSRSEGLRVRHALSRLHVVALAFIDLCALPRLRFVFASRDCHSRVASSIACVVHCL